MQYAAFKTLLWREVKRFLKVYNQTIIAPIINSILYFSVFTIVFTKKGVSIEQALNYKAFVASGIIVMAMLQQAFANTQSSITTAKVLGFVIDFIIPPLSKRTLLLAILLAGVIRGLLLGVLSFIVFGMFINFDINNIFLLIFYSVFSCALFALIGIIVGCLSKSFDSAVSYNTYFINPLTFLSGTFYSIAALPSFWQKMILLNPVFYIIDGIRYSIIGVSESPLPNHFIPIIILMIWTIVLSLISYYILKEKYHDH